MDKLLRRKLTLKLNLNGRKKEYTFLEPTIFEYANFIMSARDSKTQKETEELLKSIIHDINFDDFLSGPNKFIRGMMALIEGKSQKSFKKDLEKDVIKKNNEEGVDLISGFFPASLDVICERYGLLPANLIKEITLSQLETLLDGISWNINIQVKKQTRNINILEKYINEEQEDADRKFVEEMKNNKNLGPVNIKR